MSCIEPDMDSSEITVSQKMAALHHRAEEIAIRTTEIAVLTYKPGAVWINPVQVRETEFALKQAMASVRHIMRHCGADKVAA